VSENTKSECGAGQFCDGHAEDYEDVFGERLIEFSIEENEKP
jgi:hypothetical protein